MAMTNELMESLLNEEEGSALDFKRDQYPFDQATDEEKSELLKDILAFANAWRRTTSYILVGVDEVKGGRSIVVGLTQHLADNNLQQFVNGKTNRPVAFSYEAFPFEDKQVGVITIPLQERPVFLTRDFGKLKKEMVYVRRNSSTDVALPDEVAKMGAASAIDARFQKEIDEQRRERESQQRLQVELHGRAHRPHVWCDFPIMSGMMHLRVKNYGTVPAMLISISVAPNAVELPPVACLTNTIPFLGPDEALLYPLAGPKGFQKLPPSFVLNISYTDYDWRPFEATQPYDFGHLGLSSPDVKGVGWLSEHDSAVARELHRIADLLEK